MQTQQEGTSVSQNNDKVTSNKKLQLARATGVVGTKVSGIVTQNNQGSKHLGDTNMA